MKPVIFIKGKLYFEQIFLYIARVERKFHVLLVNILQIGINML